MKSVFVAALLAAGCVAQVALAEEIDSGGTLNPDEMSLNKSLSRALEGDVEDAAPVERHRRPRPPQRLSIRHFCT